MTLTLRRKCAFTLAEVLVTLSILGVVAAVTIPSIHQIYKRKITETRFKQAYAMLDNALAIAKIENGGLRNMIPDRPDTNVNDNNFTSFNKNFAENYLMPYLNVSAACGRYGMGGNIWSGGLTASCPKPKSKIIKGPDGTTDAFNLAYVYLLKLKNGMNLYVGTNTYAQGLGEIVFYVDIDGDKGKNQVGYDIFSFSVWKPNTGSCSTPRNPYCNYSDEFFAGNSSQSYQLWLRDRTPGTLKCNEYGGGAYCSTAIYDNGFRIPDDYPVKYF